jgi:hypothetical protein
MHPSPSFDIAQDKHGEGSGKSNFVNDSGGEVENIE